MSATPPPESVQAPAAFSFRAKRSHWDVQREVLFALTVREATNRVGGQWVGAVWTLFEPMAHMAFMLVLYGVVFTRQAPAGEYLVFLITGLVPFFLFQNLSNRLIDGIDANRGLFVYRQVKPIDVLVARSLVELLMTGAVYVVTLTALGFFGFHVIPSDPLAMMEANALMALLGFGWGLTITVVTHEQPKLRSMVRMAMLPLYLISGVIFPIQSLPQEYLQWLLWNPILHLLELSRHAFIPQYQVAAGVSFGYPVIYTMGLLTLGLALYWRNRQELAGA